MTNYNEKLDEILRDYADEHRNHTYEFDNKEISQYEYFESMRNDKEKAKQAITSVINQQVIQARDNIVQIIRSTDYTPKSLDELYDRALIELYKNQLIDLIKEYKGE